MWKMSTLVNGTFQASFFEILIFLWVVSLGVYDIPKSLGAYRMLGIITHFEQRMGKNVGV